MVYIKDYLTALGTDELPAVYNEDRTVLAFPDVVSTNSKGKTLHWIIRVTLLDAGGQLVPIEDEMLASPGPDLGDFQGAHEVSSWQGESGKIRDTVPTFVTSGKNLGKANATNVLTQALRDALGLYNRRLKSSRSRASVSSAAADTTATADIAVTTDTSTADPLPMLVKKEGQTKKSTLTPEMYARGLTAQEKLNGVRVVIRRDKAANAVLGGPGLRVLAEGY